MDPDEFLLLKQDRSIEEFLDRYPEADAIAINWKIFGSGGIQHKGKGLTVERFLMAANKDCRQHRQFKSIFRYTDNIRRFHHKVIYPDSQSQSINYIFSDGRSFSVEQKKPGFGEAFSMDDITFDFAQINHYTIRSLDEFWEKMGRGNGIQPVGANENGEMYLKKFDKSQVYESDILRHLPGYLEIYESISQ